MEDDGDRSENSVIKNEVNVDTKLSASDLLGLGKFAKTKAGQKVTEVIGNTIAGFMQAAGVAALGNRVSDVEARRMVTMARAQGEAALIEEQYKARIAQAAASRLTTEELRAQKNIEDATAEAVRIADANYAGEGQQADVPEINEELALTWVEGLKTVKSKTVLSMYSHIMASRTARDPTKISGPALSLLKNLDGQLAEALERFAIKKKLYGSYPHSDDVSIDKDSSDLEALKELGFLKTVGRRAYVVRGFNVYLGGAASRSVGHPCVDFTVLGSQLANVIYSEEYIARRLTENPVNQDEAREDFLRLFRSITKRINRFEILVMPIEGKPFDDAISVQVNKEYEKSDENIVRRINELAEGDVVMEEWQEKALMEISAEQKLFASLPYDHSRYRR